MTENPKARVNLLLLGSFRMIGSNGVDCTPRGRKTCALLALLALAPDKRRSRKWIQDKLWSDRANEQGSASLRQSLAEIRRCLGQDRNCLITDNYVVALATERVCIDVEEDSNFLQHSIFDGELLEGLDIRDPEFEDWLRDQRRRIDSSSEAAPGEVDKNGHFRCRGEPAPHRLVLSRGREDGSFENSILADGFVDTIAKTISELGVAEILDSRGDSNPTNMSGQTSADTMCLGLRTNVAKSSTGHVLRVVLSKFPERKVLWSNIMQHDKASTLDVFDDDALSYINQSVNVTIDQFVRLSLQHSPNENPTLLCQTGILTLYRLGRENFVAADELFSRAFEIQPRGIYVAWRAFVRTFMLAERQFSCRDTLEEEALHFTRKALEMEPHNSFVASLCAHVHSIIRRSHVAAFELAERSLQLNRANPFGWACLGVAKCHLGKPEEGLRDTLVARKIAGSAPYRFHLDGLSCIAGSMAGELEMATRCGEASHMMAPEFAPPLRYLSALYLHAGKVDRSQQMIRKLQLVEPDFSLEKLADEAYPTAGLQSSVFVKSLPAR